MLCFKYFLCSILEKLFSLTYRHLYPQYIVATYDYSHADSTYMEDIMLTFILRVGVVYPCKLMQVWCVLMMYFLSCNVHLRADTVN